jgi:hypothetical protein
MTRIGINKKDLLFILLSPTLYASFGGACVPTSCPLFGYARLLLVIYGAVCSQF